MDVASIALRSGPVCLSCCCGAGSKAWPMPSHSGCSSLGGQGRESSPGWALGPLSPSPGAAVWEAEEVWGVVLRFRCVLAAGRPLPIPRGEG